MIVEHYIDLIVSSKTLQYYLDKGYNAKNKEHLLVKNEDLPQKSRVKEKRICDIDGKEYLRSHRAWTDTFNSFGMDLCPECAREKNQEKVRESNLKKWGVEYPMQSKEIRQKAIETCNKNYGCDYSFQNKEVSEKAKQSIIEKYGVITATQCPEVIQKTKETNLKRYGCENVSQNDSIKEKITDTMLKKYGKKYAGQVEEFKEKAKNTLIENYGVEHPLQNERIHEKAIQTTVDRYGVKYAMQSKEVQERAVKTLCENGSVPTSSQQKELFEMVRDLSEDYFVTLNKQCSKCSLDIELILPSGIKIDVEYDGYHWHQDEQKDRRRDEVIKTYGYKILRVKSRRKLPTIEQLKESIQYLEENECATYSHIILDDWENN